MIVIFLKKKKDNNFLSSCEGLYEKPHYNKITNKNRQMIRQTKPALKKYNTFLSSSEGSYGPDLGPSCLKRLLADDTSRWLLGLTEMGAVKKEITFSSQAVKADTRLHMHTYSQ